MTSKTKKRILFLVAALLVLCGGACLIFANTSYTKVIESNWGIDLPEAGAKDVYSFSESSVHGDGIRYHVIDYPAGNETKRILNAMWQIERIFSDTDLPTEKQLTDAENLLKEIGIPDDEIPDLSRSQLLYKTREDGSQLYLFYWSGTGTIYVIESFF